MTLALDIPLNDTQFSAQRKSEVLVEALPWIRRFQGRTVVVKYGGNAMVDPGLQQAFADDIVFMASVGFALLSSTVVALRSMRCLLNLLPQWSSVMVCG